MCEYSIQMTSSVFIETPSLDRHVNEPMLAELFNIIGFQLSSKPRKHFDLIKFIYLKILKFIKILLHLILQKKVMIIIISSYQ